MRDLEQLDEIKADVSMVKQIEERVERLDKLIQEQLARDEESEEELYGEESD
jgi:hypothetical protein